MATDQQWDEQVEVLVVGSGFAGLTAAITASEAGKKTIIIEKMKKPGGNSMISDGGIAAPDTWLQKKREIRDSEELMYEDMIRAGLGLNHPDLLRMVVSQARNAFLWTIDELHVPYLDRVDLFGGHRVARCYTPEGKSGKTIIKRMLTKVDELGIPLRCSTFFQSFVLDDHGQVAGCTVLQDYDYKTGSGQPVRIRTMRGIILASGGYGADITFRSLQDPRLDDKVQTTNKPFATAEALRSALEIGAASVQLSQIQLGAWASPDEPGFGDGPLFADYIVFQHGVIIDPVTGKRFVNELGDRKQSADAILQIGHPCIGIADDRAVQSSGWDISKAVHKGVVRIFHSFDELAAFYQMDKGAVTSTLERYNRFVIQGRDDDFRKPIVHGSAPITRAPFYAMRLWPKVHFTMGGLAINQNAQVIDYHRQPITGLYAAGEIAGGVHGASRLGSCAVTECLVFGRIAGNAI